jgi:hypothetical protein
MRTGSPTSQGAIPPQVEQYETAVNAKLDMAGNVSSCGVSSDAPQNIPRPYVVPGLPDPEPRALPFNFIRLPDTLREAETISKRPDTGCLNSPQAGLEAAIRQPPKPWLIDTVAALTHACLAGHAAVEELSPRLPGHLPDGHLSGQSGIEELRLQVPEIPPGKSVVGEGEFRLRVPKLLPDKSVAAEERHSYCVVSKTIRTSTNYSPTPEAALSLPELLPAFLLQAPIPHPRFSR